GDVRTEHFRDTEGQAPTWSRTPPGRRLPHPPASPGPAVRRQDTRSAVSSAQGQDRGQRQDATSLREGGRGSPEDNLVHIPGWNLRSNQSWRKCSARLPEPRRCADEALRLG